MALIKKLVEPLTKVDFEARIDSLTLGREYMKNSGCSIEHINPGWVSLVGKAMEADRQHH
jgi:hypothetical protein